MQLREAWVLLDLSAWLRARYPRALRLSGVTMRPCQWVLDKIPTGSRDSLPQFSQEEARDYTDQGDRGVRGPTGLGKTTQALESGFKKAYLIKYRDEARQGRGPPSPHLERPNWLEPGPNDHRSLQAPEHWEGARDLGPQTTVHLLWTGTGWGWDNHRAIQTVTKGNKALEPPPPPTKASHQGFWADGPAQQVPAQIHPPSSKRASRPPPQDPGQLSLDPARASEGPHQCHPNTPAPNEDKKVLEQMGMPQTSCSPRQDGPFQGPGRGAWVPFPFQGGGSSVIVQNEIQRKPQWEDTRREVVFTLPDPKLSPCRPSPHTP